MRARAAGACVAIAICAVGAAQEFGPMPSDGGAVRTVIPAGSDASRQAGAELERRPLGASNATATPWSNQPTNSAVPAQNPASLSGMVRTVLSLAGVVAVIVCLAYGVKRLSRGSGGLMNQLGAGGRAPSGVLSILGRYPVARGTTLVLLKVDRRVLLLCQTAGKGLTAGCTMQTLSEFADPEDVASILLKTRDEEEASMAHRFEAILSREDDAALRALRDPAPPAPAKPTQTRAARAAAKQPSAVLRPSPRPSDPRAQIGRQAETIAASSSPVERRAPIAPASGSLLRGVVA